MNLTAHPNSILVYLALGALIAWRVRSRWRRMVGRQRLTKYRAPITLVLFGALMLLFVLAATRHPASLATLLAALGAGAALSRLGLRLTRFEALRGQGLFFTPDTRLGVALSLLFVARIGYRIVEVATAPPGWDHSVAQFASSPLTLGVCGLLAGYHMAYAVGLARWRRQALAHRGTALGA